MNVIEIGNESKKAIWVMACKTKYDQDKTYIHIGNKRTDLHDGIARKVEPNDYEILEINDVDF